jgi:FkbM family methyltransferase
MQQRAKVGRLQRLVSGLIGQGGLRSKRAGLGDGTLSAVDQAASVPRIVAHADLMARLRDCGFVPDYEALLEASYRAFIRPGDTVVDVGAHAGLHTAVFCDLVGRSGFVLAFEPLPTMFAALEARGLRTRLVNCALAAKAGRTSFTFARGAPGESGLRQRIFNFPEISDPVVIEVEVKRLDDFLPELSSCRFIKIDIEGGEIDCLRGAAQTIGKFRPFMSVEYGAQGYSVYGFTRRTLFDLATEYGYMLGDLFGALCPDAETWNQVCDNSYWDYHMVPRERAAEWRYALGATSP